MKTFKLIGTVLMLLSIGGCCGTIEAVTSIGLFVVGMIVFMIGRF
jgi:hypothetical protein